MYDQDEFIFVILLLTIAGYALLALGLFARALYGIISQRRGARQSVEGPAHVTDPDRSAGVVFKPGVRGLLSGGRNVRSWANARVSA